jgi:hypothetical protein
MSDGTHVFANAWKSVIPYALRRHLTICKCAWHIEQAWDRNVSADFGELLKKMRVDASIQNFNATIANFERVCRNENEAMRLWPLDWQKKISDRKYFLNHWGPGGR